MYDVIRFISTNLSIAHFNAKYTTSLTSLIIAFNISVYKLLLCI